jgi:hypothetical protein
MSNPKPNMSGLTPFRADNQPDRANRPPTKRNQLLALQQDMFRRATDLKTANKDAASCALAFERIERLLRAMSMKADPRPIDTLELTKVRRRHERPANVIEASESPGPLENLA